MEQEDLSFEEAFGQLEQTVSALEQGDLTLDRALALFEKGMHLVRRCNSVLDGAELRVRQLLPQDDGVAIADLD